MEYKKNRQKTILEALEGLSGTDKSIKLPIFLTHSQAAKGIKRSREDIASQIKRLDRTATAILSNPSGNDPIYKVCQRLFKNKNAINLTRKMEVRHEIRELAKSRFILGYPPRKDRDTSIGDAINWEWIVYCAKLNDSDVVIATRDSDYGVITSKIKAMNDWLVQEFKERVGSQRTVTLTDSLTNGLKLANITVTKTEQKAEKAFLAFDFGSISTAAMARALIPGMAASFANIGREALASQDQAVLAALSKIYGSHPNLSDFLNASKGE